MGKCYNWQNKAHEVCELDYWKLYDSIGKTWDDEIEDTVEALYREHCELGNNSEAEFISDIVSGWLDYISLGYFAEHKPKRAEFLTYLEDERVGLSDPLSSDTEWEIG